MRADSIDVAVGARLHFYRHLRGVTQARLGAALGITFQQVQKYEQGLNRISVSMLACAAAYLETSISALVGEDAPMPLSPTLARALRAPQALQLLAAYAVIEQEDDRNLVLRTTQALARPKLDWNTGGGHAEAEKAS